MKDEINKKIVAVAIAISILCSFSTVIIPFGYSKETMAATFHDINQESVFLKQSQSGRCTLASAAMLLRRAAILNGNEDWNSITEDSLHDTAWIDGVGLRHSFTYEGITVAYGSDLNGSEEKLIELLKNHPEGIVIYNRNLPHAILVTDYTDGVFYCAETISYLPEGRIAISQASFDVGSATCYWYVSSPKLELEVVVTVPADGKGDMDADGFVTLEDARIVLRMALGIVPAEADKLQNADMNTDGEINLSDAQQVLRVALGIVSYSKT